MERRRVIYSGRVQGVGFRYTVRQIAASHPVTGYVRNLANGTVEVVVESASEHWPPFLEEIARRMQGNIAGVEIKTESPTGEFDDFDIRF